MTKRDLIRRVVAALITGALFAVIVIGLASAPPSAEDRVAALGQRLRCPVCQNEAIGDSPSETAQQMMEIVREKVAAGESDRAIVDFFVARYGQWVLLDPPLSGWFLPLWLLPVAVLIVGLLVIARRRRSRGDTTSMLAAEDARRQAELDIEELAGQVEADEVPPELADALAERYMSEKEAALRAGRAQRGAGRVDTRSRTRSLTGWGLGILAMGVVIVMVIQAVEVGAENASGDIGSFDDVTNEELEGVVAANPDVTGMRLALADRYFAESSYEAAVPHYLEVLRQDPQQATAWSRLGWSAYQLGDVDLGFEYVRRSLEIDPSQPEPQLFLGAIYLYGYSDPEAALPLLEAVALREEVPPDMRQSLEQAIAQARSAIDD